MQYRANFYRSDRKVPQYQQRVARDLGQIFESRFVSNEWISRAEGENALYFPRVDIAVGPFAIDGNYQAEYDSLFDHHNAFIEDLIRCSVENEGVNIGLPVNDVNRNARCFLAIEIENRTPSKHVLGSILNAVSLGRIGILVAWHGQKTFTGEPFDKLGQCLRLKRYVRCLTELKKNTLNLDNLLILDSQQFEEVVNRYAQL